MIIIKGLKSEDILNEYKQEKKNDNNDNNRVELS